MKPNPSRHRFLKALLTEFIRREFDEEMSAEYFMEAQLVCTSYPLSWEKKKEEEQRKLKEAS